MMGNDGYGLDPLEAPPWASETTVVKVGVTAWLLASSAGLLGCADLSSFMGESLAVARVILSALGMIVAGSAITLRYRWAPVWFLAVVTCCTAGFGFPGDWDTFRLVAFAFSGVAAVGALLVVLPMPWRMGLAAALALFHFSGIFVAITIPPPAPLMSRYLYTILYRPYLQFAYLSNAYQFYSPDPGPASELWFCIYFAERPDDPVKMEVLQRTAAGEPVRDRNGQLNYQLMTDANGEPSGERIKDAAGNDIFKQERDRHGNILKRPIYKDKDEEANPDYLRVVRWIKIPKRDRDFKDPLGQAYYRRLSLTEQIVKTTALTDYPPAVISAIQSRRLANNAEIPFDLTEGTPRDQCRIPQTDITTSLLPSYVRHLVSKYERADRPIASIRVYCVTHVITEPDRFVGTPGAENMVGTNLMDATTYKPFYQGQFNTKGELIDPSDPMLYWLVPIRKNPNARPEDFANLPRHLKLADYKRLYQDFVSKHAGSLHNEEELEK